MQLLEMTKHEGGRYHDGNGFLPWYTSPCLEWLLTLDLKRKKIFEYGVGDSTLWYRKKGARVFGVDSVDHWADYGGAEYEYESDKYPFRIYGKGDFDIVIVDGIERDECTEHALHCLHSGGFLILDNWLQPSVEMNWHKTQKLIEGMPQTLYKEPGHYDWCTLVVTKP